MTQLLSIRAALSINGRYGPLLLVFRRSLQALFLYNAGMKTWDVIIIGGGIIGLSLSIELRKKGASVLVVERGEPGREASHAAGGILVDCGFETPAAVHA